MRLLSSLTVFALPCLLAACSSTPETTAAVYRGDPPAVINGQVYAPESAPVPVKRAIAAGNAIQHMPYMFGGGHSRPSEGLDCSGTVSYVLRSAGLFNGSAPSKAFKSYGKSGPGRYITLFARDGHVFMTICGMRLDTTSGGNGHVGPRWHNKPRKTERFTMRHPPGL